MKKTVAALAALILAVLLCACSGNIDKLDGKWTADAVESMKLSGKTLDGGMGQAMAEKLFGAITMTVDAKAKKLAFGFGNNKQEGGFNVASDSGKTVVLENQGKKLVFEFVNNDMVTMRDDKETKAIVFKRDK